MFVGDSAVQMSSYPQNPPGGMDGVWVVGVFDRVGCHIDRRAGALVIEFGNPGAMKIPYRHHHANPAL